MPTKRAAILHQLSDEQEGGGEEQEDDGEGDALEQEDGGVGGVVLAPVLPIKNAWEDLSEDLSSESLMREALGVRAEQQHVMQEMNRLRAIYARKPELHAHERKLNVLTKARIAQAKQRFLKLSQQSYRTSAKVEQTLNLLTAVRQHIRDTEMAIRAEDYKRSYLLARLETEQELIPDESLLSLETSSLEARAQVLWGLGSWRSEGSWRRLGRGSVEDRLGSKFECCGWLVVVCVERG